MQSHTELTSWLFDAAAQAALHERHLVINRAEHHNTRECTAELVEVHVFEV
jgi:hypothetical protein